MTTATRAFSSCSSTCTPSSAVFPQPCCPGQKASVWNEPQDAGCHSMRPPPARRRRSSTFTKQQKQQKSSPHHGSMTRPISSFSRSIFLATLLCFFFLCQGTNAGQVYGASEILPRELLFDRRPPPPLPGFPRMQQIDKRQDDSSSVSLPAVTTVTLEPTNTATGGSTIQTATETAAASLPKVFDTSLGNNFTSSTCPTFFQTFLTDQSFNECLPFSLLLQTSNSFFLASRSLVRLTQTLSATCNVDFDKCSDLMAGLARQIGQDAACGADLEMGNPVVTQAYDGFIAYPTLYHAGCLTDSDGNYCYANAVTNTSATTSSYIYYLPLGVSLPGGSRPACTQCMQDTMSIFAQTAGNSTQPLSKDYTDAAEQIQMNCGPTFVESTVRSTSGATSTSTLPGLTGFFVLLSIAIQLLV